MNEAEYRTMFEAEDRHWWYVALHELILRFLEKEGQQKGRLRIFDAGCGTGRLCQLMAPHGEIEGCDMSESAILFCNSRGLGHLFRADLNTLGMGSERYDVVTSIDVLYHSAIRDDRLLVGKMFRALKPGGVLILQSPAYSFLRSRHDAAVHTRKRYVRGEILRLLKEAGFTVETASYRISFLFAPVALYRLITKFSGMRTGRQPRSDVSTPPALINRLLLLLVRAEDRLVGSLGLPFGTSVFAVARKPL